MQLNNSGRGRCILPRSSEFASFAIGKKQTLVPTPTVAEENTTRPFGTPSRRARSWAVGCDHVSFIQETRQCVYLRGNLPFRKRLQF
ncbi:mCG1028085 [Mus musculus]|jgi:hypothetical protein|nr:mCG1028085 [Mus musculus]